MGNAIRVLCVDDHRLMREGIARIVGVQPDMTVVAEAADGEQAVEQFLRYRPDVTLMDLEMLVLTGGGRERSKPEFRRLFAAAGLHLDKTLRLSEGAWVMIGRKVSKAAQGER